MKRSKLLAFLCVCLAFVSTSANALLIVDTGAGGTSGTSQPTFGNFQFLAVEFNVASDTTITDIEGWMLATGSTDVGTIAIYNDDAAGGEIPGTELFSTAFTGGGFFAHWGGAHGLGLNILAGNYWVSFESRAGQNMSGTMPGGTPNPLTNGAHRNSLGTWFENNGDIGVRITASPVPVPAAVWLFGSGLIGLMGMRKKPSI